MLLLVMSLKVLTPRLTQCMPISTSTDASTVHIAILIIVNSIEVGTRQEAAILELRMPSDNYVDTNHLNACLPPELH